MRGSKLTKDVHDKIMTLLKTGHTDISACAMVGVAQRTFYNWITRGKKEEDGIYADFSRDVEKARGISIAYAFEKFKECANKSGDWKAWMTFLERRDPRNYSRYENVNVNAQVSAHVLHELIPHGTLHHHVTDSASIEQSRRLLERLASSESGGPDESPGTDVLLHEGPLLAGETPDSDRPLPD